MIDLLVFLVKWLSPKNFSSYHIEYSDDRKRVKYIEDNIFSELSNQRLKLLGLIVRLLRKTADQAEINKMYPRNLAAVWTPNLVRCESLEEEMKLLVTSQKFVEVLIELYVQLFDE